MSKLSIKGKSGFYLTGRNQKTGICLHHFPPQSVDPEVRKVEGTVWKVCALARQSEPE